MKILVVRLSAMGDLILLTGPLRELKKQKPDYEIHLLTTELGHELLSGSTDIDHFHILSDRAGLFQYLRLLLSLESYDFIFDMQGKAKTQFARFILSGSFKTINKQNKERRAFVKKRQFRDALTDHVVQKYFALFALYLDLETPWVEKLRPQLIANPLVFNKQIFDFTKAYVIHPYASQKNKEWPWAKNLIQELDKEGQSVVIIGQSKEPLNIELKNGLNLTNKTSPREMIAIIQACKGLLSTDSGPMHIGVAVNKPVWAIFGPTTREFGFAPQFDNCTIIENISLDCRPCHIHGGNHCPLRHHSCMKDITVNQVQESLRKL